MHAVIMATATIKALGLLRIHVRDILKDPNASFQPPYVTVRRAYDVAVGLGLLLLAAAPVQARTRLASLE